jgi:antitoxin (DNA-binding transcriptional repressor) of toxin-antitoxin stability system
MVQLLNAIQSTLTILVMVDIQVRNMPRSLAEAGFSEVVRTVRRTGEPVVITVDGEPAAQIFPVDCPPRRLPPAEVATVRALMVALARMPRSAGAFDAVALIAEGAPMSEAVLIEHFPNVKLDVPND